QASIASRSRSPRPSTPYPSARSSADGRGAPFAPGSPVMAEPPDSQFGAARSSPCSAPGAAISYLYGVSCTAASSCTAVGSYYNSANVHTTLAEYWDGSTWTTQATPPRFRKGSQLLAVSCTAPGRCTAVGSYFGPGGGGGAAGRALLGRDLAGPANPGPIRDDRRQPGRNLVHSRGLPHPGGGLPDPPGQCTAVTPPPPVR